MQRKEQRPDGFGGGNFDFLTPGGGEITAGNSQR